jgi:hypothetical protein
MQRPGGRGCHVALGRAFAAIAMTAALFGADQARRGRAQRRGPRIRRVAAPQAAGRHRSERRPQRHVVQRPLSATRDEVALLAQHDKQFVPRVADRARQTALPNEDDIYHNVFSVSLPRPSISAIQLRCAPHVEFSAGLVPPTNIHPQMLSYVAQNDAYAVTMRTGLRSTLPADSTSC